MAPKEKRTKWFHISNSGNSELIIENVRSLCDCIVIGQIPESVAPGQTDSIEVTYTALDSSGHDESSFVIRTNSDPKNTKVTIVAEILPLKLSLEDSTITVIPFQTGGMPNPEEYSIQLYEKIIAGIPENYPKVNPNELAAKLQSDPNYTVEPLQDITRKWINLLGIRFAILGDVRPEQTGKSVTVSIMMVDGLFHLPVAQRISGVAIDDVSNVIADSVNSILANLAAYEKQALFQDFQRKWAEQRQKLIKNPAPEIKMENVRTGKLVSTKDFEGQPLVIQFFSEDCDHCEEEMTWLSELVTKNPHIGAIGVSVDVGEIDSVRSYLLDKNPPYPVIIPDEENETQLDPYYGGATPQTVIVNPDGIVVESLVGFSQGSLKRFENILSQMSVK